MRKATRDFEKGDRGVWERGEVGKGPGEVWDEKRGVWVGGKGRGDFGKGTRAKGILGKGRRN